MDDATVQKAPINPLWKSKVARYFAYNIDGGLLQSKFTLAKMIKMMEFVNDPKEKETLLNEITYLSHIRKKGKEYLPEKNGTHFDKLLKEITTNYPAYQMNFKVLCVLIET